MKYRFTEPLEKERSSSYGSNFFVCRSRKLSRRVTAFSTIVFDNMMILETDAPNTRKKTDGRGRIPLNRHRIFKKPAYVIEKETDGRVNVYVY